MQRTRASIQVDTATHTKVARHCSALPRLCTKEEQRHDQELRASVRDVYGILLAVRSALF